MKKIALVAVAVFEILCGLGWFRDGSSDGSQPLRVRSRAGSLV
jgi:hypothetical protein